MSIELELNLGLMDSTLVRSVSKCAHMIRTNIEVARTHFKTDRTKALAVVAPISFGSKV